MSIFCTDTPRSNAERIADWRNRLKRYTEKHQCAFHYLQQLEDSNIDCNQYAYDCNKEDYK